MNQLANKKFSANAQSLLSNNLKEIRNAGLVTPGSPSDLTEEEKRFPKELSSLTSDQVMDKLTIFTGLFAYASVLESAAKIEMTEKERELEVLEAREYLLSEDSQVTTRKYARDTAESVIRCKEELLAAESKYVMLKALKEGYDKMTFVLSRQLSLQMDHRS